MAAETVTRRTRRWAAVAAIVALAGTGAACGGDDEDTADFCEKYRQYEDQNEQVSEQFQDDPENVDLEEAKQVFTDVANQIEDLAGEAPEEIQDDVETVSQAVTDFADQVEQAEDPEQFAETVLQAGDESEEVDEAGSRIDDWVQDNCDSEGAK